MILPFLLLKCYLHLQIDCPLGYPSLESLKKLVPSLNHLSSLECESCQLGKYHRAIFLEIIEDV